MSEEKNEAETPKSTVIVTTETGREIRFNADEFDAEDQLDVRDTSRKANSGIVGSFAAGRWRDVRLDGVTEPDDAGKALGIARRALSEINRTASINAALKLANDALGELFGLGFE